jgi:hypothetical protein
VAAAGRRSGWVAAAMVGGCRRGHEQAGSGGSVVAKCGHACVAK